MQILLVGGAGDVGKHLIQDYTQKGHTIRVLDLAPMDPETATKPGVTWYQGSQTDKELVQKAVRGADVVIHLAWSFSDDPHVIFGTDILGTAILLDAVSAAGIRTFIYTSTAVVYGRAVHHPVTEEHPCLIEEARKPFYALGKHATEKLCLLQGKQRGLKTSILRFWWGFENNLGGKHLRDLIKTAKENQPIKMVSNAGGAFVTMSDLASIISLMMEHDSAAGQTFNAGSLFLTWQEIGKMIIELTNSSSGIELVPSVQWKGPAFLNEIWDLSWNKATNRLGYQPQQSDKEARALFKEALKNSIDQLK